MTLANVLAVADAVLYEGYLLYPYRSTSAKNQSRWQFGVLGPPGAYEAGLGECAEMHSECLLEGYLDGVLTIHLRFLQLQSRVVERAEAISPSGYEVVDELQVGAQKFVTWDEAAEQEVEIGPFPIAELVTKRSLPVVVDGGVELEVVESEGETVGRIIRRRWPIRGAITVVAIPVIDEVVRLEIHLANVASQAPIDRHEATRASMLGAHMILEARDAAFVSLLEPPDELKALAGLCQNRRCWPVLVGEEGSTDTVLVSPIILYDYPEIAPESAGSLFDSTEIDEILTLRVMTLTEAEKVEARSTDPAAAAIIDRCDGMTPEELQQLHGILRGPRNTSDWAHGPDGPEVYAKDTDPRFSEDSDSPSSQLGAVDFPSFVTPDNNGEPESDDHKPWWDPGVEASVSPSTDVVMIDGVAVTKGSQVRLHPSRSADAQDLFFANESATVTAIFADVDGRTHIAVVINSDPAADLHEWYGRYLYFAPEEIEPLELGTKTSLYTDTATTMQEETR